MHLFSFADVVPKLIHPEIAHLHASPYNPGEIAMIMLPSTTIFNTSAVTHPIAQRDRFSAEEKCATEVLRAVCPVSSKGMVRMSD